MNAQQFVRGTLTELEVEAWAGFFRTGSDAGDRLADLGLNDETAWPIAESTWHRIGQDVIDHVEDEHIGFHPPARPFWAEEEFGPPRPHGAPALDP